MNNKPSLFSHRVLMPTFFGAAWKAMRNEAAEESESQQRRRKPRWKQFCPWLHTGAGKLLGKGYLTKFRMPVTNCHSTCPNMSKMLALLEIPFGDWNNQACTHINDKDHRRSAIKLSQSAFQERQRKGKSVSWQCFPTIGRAYACCFTFLYWHTGQAGDAEYHRRLPQPWVIPSKTQIESKGEGSFWKRQRQELRETEGQRQK